MFSAHFKTIAPLALILVGLVGYNFMSAQWTPPTGIPPSGNVPAPINVSSVTQTKTGTLNVRGNLNVGGNLDVATNTITTISAATDHMRSDLYCDRLGNNCFDSASIITIINNISIIGTNWLVYNQHTEEGCTALGGIVVSDGTGNKFCRFNNRSTCQPGWTQYNSYMAYTGNTCTSQDCNSGPVGCTVAGSAWGSRPGAALSCTYTYAPRSGNQSCSTALNTGTCTATVTSIGCY